MATGKKITNYALFWNPFTNKEGRVVIVLDDGTRKDLPVETQAEFLALAAILNQSSVYMRDDGLIGGAPSAEHVTA